MKSTKSIDNSQKHNPLTLNPLSHIFWKVNPDVSILEYYTINLNKIVNSFGIFSEPETIGKYVEVKDYWMTQTKRIGGTITCNKADANDENGCIPYIAQNFISGFEDLTINRDYPFILDTLEEIRGFRDIIISSVALFYAFYNGFFLNRFLYKSFFPENKQENFFILSYFLCCKKKKEREKFEAFESINEESVDYLELIKSYNEWKVVKQVNFNESHWKLFPFLLLQLQKDKIDKEKGIKERILIDFDDKTIIGDLERLKEVEPKSDIEALVNKLFLENLGEKKDDFGISIKTNRVQGSIKNYTVPKNSSNNSVKKIKVCHSRNLKDAINLFSKLQDFKIKHN